ncbi:MAG: response regulator transcription factor [Firmicutes bacterium]|nr:response regulator transcription factor [Bacillota bacterium]
MNQVPGEPYDQPRDRGTRVLVVDDEQGILELVEYHLRRAGFDVLLADTGLEGFRLARDASPDLVILDLMLPDLDGLTVCRRIRCHSRVPVLLLTARADEADRQAGLEAGADGFITKPFHPRELVAAVRELLDRTGGPGEMPERLAFGGLEVDLIRRAARLSGQDLHLSPTEFALLRALVEKPGRWQTRSDLLDRVWGRDFVGDPRVVDMYVGFLREKLNDDLAFPRWVEGGPDRGYRWRGGGYE